MLKSLTSFLLILCCGSLITFAQDWEQKANFPNQERDHPVGFHINGTAYLLTGMYEENGNNFILRDFYTYDVANDEWASQGNFPGEARGFSIGLAHQGKGYIGFGAGRQLHDDLWEYDPQTDNWEQLPDCPCDARRHPALEAVNGKIYVGLGDGQSGNLKDWWVLDLETEQWSQIPDMPGPPRHHPYHFTIAGKIYAGMGHGARFAQGSSPQGVLSDWYEYDPKDSAWTQLNEFPGQPRVAGTQFSHSGKGYVLSGDGSDHGFMDSGQFWQYSPQTDEWKELPAHPGVSIWAPTSFVADGYVYQTGGLNRKTDNRINKTWRFDLTESTGTDLQAQNTPEKLNVYPNPAQNFIQLPQDIRFETLQILNARGKVMQTKQGNQKRIEVSQLPEGMYFLRAERDEKTYQARFIKQ